ncbi:MAG: hypothetical protein LQ351_005612 [Letrouitia transgressa]|nr:MAG: hypothetical protein LQ351_005612 [Letrouitia transgressa]
MADSDYYSHAESNGSATGDDSRFLDFGVSLTQAHKTGLGSSAALVTAFTAAVLSYYEDGGHIPLNSEYERACLHNLAQAAHCAAQGKVGSGFDVAAAVYGSCVYRRFSPSILQGLGEIGSKGFSSRLRAVVEDTDSLHKWDTQIDKSSSVIPKGLRLFMCDVDCGSETVGLVKQVLSWKKEDPNEATRLWTTLQKENEVLAQELRRLSSDCGGSAGDYDNLSDIVLKVRSLIREMSSKARVPIEPEVQTRLIDACRQLPGVVAGVVPGAGGFDAIALLVRDDEEVFRNLKDFLGSYRSPGDVAEGGNGIGKVKLLGVKQEMEGLKEEDAKIYANWIQ